MLRATDNEFDAFVEQAIADLPEEFRRVFERVPVIVEARPDPALIHGLEDIEGPDDLFGLFVGPPLAEWDTPDAPPELACIYLFRVALLTHCLTLDELAAEVRTTLYHELAHALGFEEQDMQRLGLE
ncbi:MAG: Zn-dependent protease [Planctomycetota bacterium]|nr:MAG: Zn-dependent protease [Planctomycetota bacterium]